jgi:hypothetical protein
MAETATRNFAQRASTYAAEKIEKSKTVAEEATRVMEHSYTAASKGAVDFNVKLIDLVQENVNDAFNFARELQRVQTPTAFFEVSTAHARKQWEKVASQGQQLAGLAQKAVLDATQSMQSASKTISQSS